MRLSAAKILASLYQRHAARCAAWQEVTFAAGEKKVTFTA
jgi:hypothetical protein